VNDRAGDEPLHAPAMLDHVRLLEVSRECGFAFPLLDYHDDIVANRCLHCDGRLRIEGANILDASFLGTNQRLDDAKLGEKALAGTSGQTKLGENVNHERAVEGKDYTVNTWERGARR
jgi:hypothetical protein